MISERFNLQNALLKCQPNQTKQQTTILTLTILKTEQIKDIYIISGRDKQNKMKLFDLISSRLNSLESENDFPVVFKDIEMEYRYAVEYIMIVRYC